ncbi:pyridoxal phosphate-dependent aminotransferase family protein [Pontixanthobacter gangjinensis]|uniref:8-amino-7-oxononanoate synthase n=1 Tax=Christiangramia aestuarii TaxID=1028746 RepID=A0A7K1LNL3_9FLAO|nr:8-amino-7-oxononanoate synthase [Christiangramia aestuarii]MUP42394.1 8-amino-7-oxononanoate synthase [Christiangramia aestuarii]
MKKLPSKLEKRLQKRKEDDSFRELLSSRPGVDFFSNDYLGFSNSEEIFEKASRILKTSEVLNGSTGSRLLSGNHSLFKLLENQLASFHNAQSALVFNSGYDANIGLFSAIPQKGDIILYDELSHASIRDGLQMSLARNYKFLHNDLQDLEAKLKRFSSADDDAVTYVVTESVFSMDGDSPDLDNLLGLTEKYGARLIVDEAHATGVLGENGQGMVQQLKLETQIFARIHTFGKAIGAHGAVVVGSRDLKDYLVNFSRSFIYTTALSPHSVATISAVYRKLENDPQPIKELRRNIDFFRAEIKKNKLDGSFADSNSAIQVCVIPGNSLVRNIASQLSQSGFNVKAILSPTVPAGAERLRFCVHSYNSFDEISQVLKDLGNFVAKNK